MSKGLQERLKPFFTIAFLKFCAVGASGVVVNLGILAALQSAGVRSTTASALAIYISILTNFVMNEWWTFKDRREHGQLLRRALRFQLVSLVGASVQWAVFVGSNVALLGLVYGHSSVSTYFAGVDSTFIAMSKHAVLTPPEIGRWILLAQVCGIGVATVWNFLANFNWTWRTNSD